MWQRKPAKSRLGRILDRMLFTLDTCPPIILHPWAFASPAWIPRSNAARTMPEFGSCQRVRCIQMVSDSPGTAVCLSASKVRSMRRHSRVGLTRPSPDGVFRARDNRSRSPCRRHDDAGRKEDHARPPCSSHRFCSIFETRLLMATIRLRELKFFASSFLQIIATPNSTALLPNHSGLKQPCPRRSGPTDGASDGVGVDESLP
ncbi:hypothetical protein BO70DRAFT_138525 [Aspergillus heteromorphus CBS 117.55]|uniref:Uncharacterized protein n=1 Tax=Aspergillus heteromorphus CBS 117.55 TaxID=1448321 RepID=A0A317VBW2_9EURO|nr:uncharacterized protein BO70DRAFT_138525 [Aspergillus heteromorphus CBS 117.55]PWY70442.1 hypothetical protein BO70DRAFT_138525 [Aspergillus heteromorphus CBS 117.55]